MNGVLVIADGKMTNAFPGKVLYIMNLLAAIKREERKLERELSKLQGKLSAVRAAAKALGGEAVREVTKVKKRVMSAAARARISKANEGAVGKI